MTRTFQLGPFRLEGPAVHGSTSEVWRGVHEELGREVAVKFLSGGDLAAPDFAAAVRDEVRAVAALDHPGIVRLYDHGIAPEGSPVPGAPYLLMEWADEGSIDGWEPADWPAVRDLLRSLLSALAHAHARRVLHLDLKPANVLRCGPENRRPGVKLADFGNASRRIEAGAPARGTPKYMSPEQAASRPGEFGPWSDLYALGGLVFRLVTGQPAVPGDTVHQVTWAHLQGDRNPWAPRFVVPAGLERWVVDLLQVDWRQRPVSAAKALEALDALDGSEAPRPEAGRGWDRLAAGLGLFGLRVTPVVGRAVEQAALQRSFRSAVRRERARAVLLEGPSGCGKSRLARWLCEQTEESGGGLALRARFGGGAGAGLVGMVLDGIGAAGLDGIEEHAAARLGEDVGTELLAAFGRTSSAPSAQRWSTIMRCVAALGRGRPVVVWLDDLHEGGEGLGFIRWALMQVEQPLLIVGTVQQEGLAAAPEEAAAVQSLREQRGVTSIRLAGLDVVELREMVERSLCLEGEAADMLAQRSGGNPLFAEQVAAAWIDGGMLVPGSGGFRLRPDADPRVPVALSEVWGRRLDELLGPGDRPALELAACLGHTVDSALWRRACVGLPDASVQLEQLLEAGLAKAGSAGWSFVHGMLREALLERARLGDRLARHHAAIADALLDPDPATLAWHQLEAGRFEQALPHFDAATRSCQDRADHRAVATLLDGIDRALDGLGLAADDPRRAPARVLRASAVRARARFDETLVLAEQGLALAVHGGDGATQAAAHLQLGRCFINLGRHAEAEESLQQATAMAELVGAAEVGAQAERMLGVALLFQGRLDESKPHLERGLAAWDALGRPGRAAWCAINLGQLAKQAGDLDTVERRLDEARARFLVAGSRVGLAECDNGLGEVHRQRGQLAQAAARYTEALAWYRAAGSSDGPIAAANLGLVELARERWDHAERALRAARETLEAQQRLEIVGILDIALAACAAAQGRPEAWRDRFESGRDALTRTGFVYLDVAWAAERAAEQAPCDRDRRDALELAAAQWQALGRGEEAARVRSAIGAIAGTDVRA